MIDASYISDQPKAIAAAVVLAVIGVAFFMAMPVVVAAWSTHAEFTAQEAGLLAAIDSGGGVVASLLVAQLINKINWRLLAGIGITFAAGANLISVYADTFLSLGLVRGLAGFGSGTIYALGLGILATTHNTGRNFSILLFVQVSFGMFEINAFPYLAELRGISGIYLAMAAAIVSSAVVLPWLPNRSKRAVVCYSPGISTPSRLGVLPWVCLCAVFLFYISAGAFWAYIELIGRSGGLSAGVITGSLTYTQILSLLGCVLAGWFSSRIGQSRPLIASLACAALAIFSLSLGITTISFIAALCVFFLLWNAIDIYQLGTLSNIDQTGRFTAMVPAFQMTAAALGPAIGAWLLALQGSYQFVLLLASFCTVCAMLL
ncbi:hypothetical protein N8739_11695, partial [Luminiphilus sp.]|nr:hypothetical protein [Luminiphilus sp.]